MQNLFQTLSCYHYQLKLFHDIWGWKKLIWRHFLSHTKLVKSTSNVCIFFQCGYCGNLIAKQCIPSCPVSLKQFLQGRYMLMLDVRINQSGHLSVVLFVRLSFTYHLILYFFPKRNVITAWWSIYLYTTRFGLGNLSGFLSNFNLTFHTYLSYSWLTVYWFWCQIVIFHSQT